MSLVVQQSQAVKNLKNIAASFGVGEIEANTVAQLLGQQPVLNKTTGVEEFVSRQLKPSIGDYDLAIIDEFSMLSSKNFEEILKEVMSAKTKIIFVGDRAQLPPVGEKEPIVATSELIRDSYTLTEVVRYDGEISKIAAEVRSDSKYNKVLYKFRTTNDHTVTKLDRDEWLDTAVDFFAEENFKHNPDYVRFLVYRNTRAAELNRYMRSQLWGENCPAYVVGDRLIAKTPVFRPVAGGKGKNKWAIAINNSEECQVIDEFELQNFDSKRYRDWQYYNVPVKTDSGLKLDLRILTPEFEKKR
ncbi:MAG: AAA family ATPase, partial [Prochloraceae cyanobacterium]